MPRLQLKDILITLCSPTQSMNVVVMIFCAHDTADAPAMQCATSLSASPEM